MSHLLAIARYEVAPFVGLCALWCSWFALFVWASLAWRPW